MNDTTPPASSAARVFYPRAAAVIAMAAAATIIIIAAWLTIDVLFLLFAGTLLGIFLQRVSRAVSRWTGLSYSWALAGVLLIALAITAAFVAYLVPTAAEQFGQLQKELASAVDAVKQRMLQYEFLQNTFRGGADQGQSGTPLIGGDRLWRTARQAVSWSVGSLAYLIVWLFIGIYLAAEPDIYVRGVAALAPPSRRNHVRQLVRDLHETLWWWLLGRLTSMAIIGVFTALGLWMLQVPLPIPLAVLAAVLTFVPNIGPTLALIPPVLLALQQSPQTALYVFLFYMALQFVESYLITPLIQRKGVSLPPVITISSQVALGLLAGALGMALAAPLAAATILLVRRVYVENILEGGARSLPPEQEHRRDEHGRD